MPAIRARVNQGVVIIIGLFVASFLLRVFSFLLFPHQGYPDSFYYTAVARSLASGHGFSVPYLFSFIDVGSVVPAHGVLPMASNAMWMPLASIIQVPFIWLLGPTDFASALPFMLMGALLAPVTYAFVRDMIRSELKETRTPAILAGLLAISTGSISAFLAQPDNFALFALIVLPVMWITGRLLRGDAGVSLGRLKLGNMGSMMVAGVFAGLAFLSRNDGVLIVLVVSLVWLSSVLIARRKRVHPAISFGNLLAFGSVAFLVVLPWLIRQMLVFGAISPAASSGRVLWIRFYQEFYSADGPLNPGYLFSWGFDNLLSSRFEALLVVLMITVVYVLFLLGTFWLPFGLHRNLRRPELSPFFLWLVILLAWDVIVDATLVTTGNYVHSVVSVMPLLYLLVADGVFEFRRVFTQRWQRFSSAGVLHKSIFVLLLVTVVFAIALPIKSASQWADERAVTIPAVTAIEAHDGTGQVVMSVDPGLIWSIDSRMPGIQTPYSSLETIRAAATAYGARWLILDKASHVNALDPVLTGEIHPAWLSAQPIYASPTSATDSTPAVVVYQIVDTGP